MQCHLNERRMVTFDTIFCYIMALQYLVTLGFSSLEAAQSNVYFLVGDSGFHYQQLKSCHSACPNLHYANITYLFSRQRV